MNIKLTLGERLKDLRVERHLKLETLAEQTGLSKSALSKYESDDVTDLSIYAVTTLAEFYGVTTDYLLGVTENKKRPDAVLSDLHLSDGAVDVLRNGKFNHRLLCELIVHENFRRFMTDLEIYVDGYVSANIQNLNAGLEATRQMLKKKYAADENDLYMSTLKLGQIDEDEYFGRVLYDELVAILKNIKTEHRKWVLLLIAFVAFLVLVYFIGACLNATAEALTIISLCIGILVIYLVVKAIKSK